MFDVGEGGEAAEKGEPRDNLDLHHEATDAEEKTVWFGGGQKTERTQSQKASRLKSVEMNSRYTEVSGWDFGTANFVGVIGVSSTS